MELFGKFVMLDGVLVFIVGGVLVWGGVGIEIQYFFFQWLYQGKDIVLVDFIGVKWYFVSVDVCECVFVVNMVVQGVVFFDGCQLFEVDEGELVSYKFMLGG